MAQMAAWEQAAGPWTPETTPEEAMAAIRAVVPGAELDAYPLAIGDVIRYLRLISRANRGGGWCNHQPGTEIPPQDCRCCTARLALRDARAGVALRCRHCSKTISRGGAYGLTWLSEDGAVCQSHLGPADGRLDHEPEPEPADLAEWRYEVGVGDTLLGFDAWVARRDEAAQVPDA